MRSTWTDERLDDFREHVDAALRSRSTDASTASKAAIDEQTGRIDGLQHTMIVFGGGHGRRPSRGFWRPSLGLIVTQL